MPSFDEIRVQLNLEPRMASRLERHATSLFDLANLDVVALAAETGIAETTLTIARDLATETLADPGSYATERDRQEFLQAAETLKLTRKSIDVLRDAGIDSFKSAREANLDFAAIDGISAARGEDLRTLTRLSAISTDPDLNQTLAKRGITGVFDLATKRAELADLIADHPSLEDIIRKAERYGAIFRAGLIDRSLERIHPWDDLKFEGTPIFPEADPLLPAEPAAAACVHCNTCHSALSPGAYLVELIATVTGSFAGLTTVTDLETRFSRPFGDLTLSCQAAERVIRAIDVANRILETFILAKRTGLDRAALYAEFAGAGFPHRTVLTETYDAFLAELATSRNEVHDALSQATATPPNVAPRDALMTLLGLTAAELATLDLSDTAIGIATVDAMSALVRKVKSKGIDANDPLQLAAAEDAEIAATQAIDRIWQMALPEIRANLIHAALAAIAAAPIAGRRITTSRALGNYLFTDLSVGSCATTTEVAAAIEAIQTFVLAFQLGREPAQLTGSRTDFDARWRWLQEYSLWHAAGMVFYYPENVVFPDVRWNQSAPFRTLLDDLEAAISPEEVEDAVNAYRQAIELLDQSHSPYVVTLNDRTFLVATGWSGKTVEITEQRPNGTWRGWTPLGGLPGEHLLGAAGFNDRIYLFFANPSNYKTLRYTWMPPDGRPPTTLATTPELGDAKIGDIVAGGDIVFIAGSDHLTAYFREWTYANTFEGACMDTYHRWWRSQPPTPIDNASRGYTWTAVGHLNGKDYLIGGSYYRVALCEIDDPHGPAMEALGEFSSPRLRSTWRVLHDYPAAATNSAAGTVSNDHLVIAIHGNDTTTTRWTHHVPGTVISWTTALSTFSPYSMIKTRDLFYCYGGTDSDTGWVYRIVDYTGNVVNLRAGGLLALRMDLLTHHPLGEPYPALDAYRNRITLAYNAIAESDFARLYLDEWFLFVPLAAAARLDDLRQFRTSIDWLNLLYYPYRGLDTQRVIYPPMMAGAVATPTKTQAWLDDPLNPHAIAAVRRGAYRRHTGAQYVETLLDWADTEFTRDTAESIARARELYELAEEILGLDSAPDPCLAAWQDILVEVTSSHTVHETRGFTLVLRPLRETNLPVTADNLATILGILRNGEAYEDKLASVHEAVKTILATLDITATSATVQDIVAVRVATAGKMSAIEDAYSRYLANSNIESGIILTAIDDTTPDNTSILDTFGLGNDFCIPPNPMLDILRWRISSNLEKIRTCRNIAGMRRAVLAHEPGADPAALVQAVAAGEAVEAAIPSEPPPLYRFSYLIERARYYADVARQLETQLLNAFEREDQEVYNLFKANQDLQLARGNTTLQDLKAREANDGIALAQLQRDRSSFQRTHFTTLVSAGILEYEALAIGNLWVAHDWMIAGAVVAGIGAIGGAIGGAVVGSIYGGPAGTAAGAIVGGIAGVLTGGGQAMRDVANVHSIASQARAMQATFQRREEDWRFQSALAGWDIRLAEQGILLANDRVAITYQERQIAVLQVQLTSDVIAFLGNKFTGVELWRWMGRTLRRYHRDHLTYATVTARMAQRALEFERQESIPIIAAVYAEREKRDLLAAEHLLSDINKLDQHRLTTEQRRKELTRTFSLAQLDPIGFNALRAGNGMAFSTLMNHFDRDFPGHYLRLVKSVSLVVVALVPPSESVQATLSNAGLSRTMVGPPFAQPRVIQRQPESIAVTAANNGTGLFEVKFDDPILLPFEGTGVETSWILDLPRGANRFDFDTLADVLFTVRYTALEDNAYREKVLTQMGMGSNRKIAAGGSLSFPVKQSLPDEWYDLFNPVFTADAADYGFEPGQVRPPYAIQFDLRPSDFPPNELDTLLSRLTIAFRQSTAVPVPIEIWFRPDGQATEYRLVADYRWDPANSATGPLAVSTFQQRRTGPTAAWQNTTTQVGTLSPFGTWRLRLRNEDATGNLVSSQELGQNHLDLGWLQDLLIVIGYDANVEYRFAS